MNRQFDIPLTANKNFDYAYNSLDWKENNQSVFPITQEFTKENLPQQEDIFHQFQQFIQANYSDDQLKLSTIACALCISQVQLYRKVKPFVNSSLINYLRAYRLQKSTELLANSNVLSIAEVAYRVGFNDPNYFSRVFTATFDQTPSEYGTGFGWF